MTVGSVAVWVAVSPPPVTVMVTVPVAVRATRTLRVMGG